MIVGAGFIPPAGVCAAAGFPGRYGIGPYRGLRYRRRRGFPVGTGLPSIVGAGFIPPAGVCAAVGCGGMRASRPTVAWVVAAVRFGGSFSVVCRGGPWPSRETLRHRGVPGTISGLRAGPAARLASETRLRAQCKHRPLQRFAVQRERGFSGLAAAFAVVRRGGFHIRPQAFAPPQGSRADMESAPTEVCDTAESAVSR